MGILWRHCTSSLNAWILLISRCNDFTFDYTIWGSKQIMRYGSEQTVNYLVLVNPATSGLCWRKLDRHMRTLKSSFVTFGQKHTGKNDIWPLLSAYTSCARCSRDSEFTIICLHRLWHIIPTLRIAMKYTDGEFLKEVRHPPFMVKTLFKCVLCKRTTLPSSRIVGGKWPYGYTIL